MTTGVSGSENVSRCTCFLSDVVSGLSVAGFLFSLSEDHFAPSSPAAVIFHRYLGLFRPGFLIWFW